MKKTLQFESVSAMCTFSEANSSNKCIADIVGLDPFVVQYDGDKNRWNMLQDNGKPYVAWNMFIAPEEFHLFTEIKPSFPGAVEEKEIAVVVNDARITKDNYMDLINYLKKVFEE